MRRGLCIKPNLIRITYAILTGLFISICSEDELLYKGFHEIGCIRLFLLWLTCIGIILIVFGAFDLLKKWIIAYKMNERYNSISLSIAILVIAWLPYMIIFSPGIMHWDTMIQIQDFFDGYNSFFYQEGGWDVSAFLSDHHPVFDTVLYGVFAWIGKILGNVNIGIALLTFSQVILMAYSISRLLVHLCDKGMTIRGKYICLLFLGLIPFYGIYVVTVVKNTTFTIAMLLFFDCYLRIQDTKTNTIKVYYEIAVLSLLVSLTNKTGIFVIVGSFLYLIIHDFKKDECKKLIFAVIPTLLTCLILFPYIIFPLANIFPGGKQEMLGAMFMQTARVVVDYDSELSEKERDVIDSVVEYDGLEAGYWEYNGTYTQEVKNKFRNGCTKKELERYYTLWIKHMFKFPKAYFRSILGLTRGFFSFSDFGNVDVYSDTTIKGLDNELNISECSFSKGLRDALKKWYEELGEIPLIDLLFRRVLYSFIIPVYVWVQSKNKYIVISWGIPFAIIWLFLFVSPCTKSRYMLPLFFLAPIYLVYSMCVSNENIVDTVNDQYNMEGK